MMRLTKRIVTIYFKLVKVVGYSKLNNNFLIEIIVYLFFYHYFYNLYLIIDYFYLI